MSPLNAGVAAALRSAGLCARTNTLRVFTHSRSTFATPTSEVTRFMFCNECGRDARCETAVLCTRRTMTEKIRDEITGVSNWTSATAEPGERHVYSGSTSTTERRPWPNAKA